MTDTERRTCPTPGCTSQVMEYGRWCVDCTMTVWRTGRPPEDEAPRSPWVRKMLDGKGVPKVFA